MKKILLICLVLIMMNTLVACGSESNNNFAVNDETSSTTTNADSSITVVTGSSSDDLDESSDVSVPVTVTEDTTTEVATYEKESTADVVVTTSTTESKVIASSSEVGATSIGMVESQVRNNAQAGLLTAGEWHDNKNFDYFMDVLNDNNWYNIKGSWNFVNWDRYEFLIVNEDNDPIINARIELHDDQSTQYVVNTDNNGYAVVYPHLNKTFIQKPKLNAKIIYNQNTYEIITLEDNYFKVTLDEKSSPVEKVDLMLMVDTTGSMEDELEFLKTELSDVVSRVMKDNANNLDINVSANYYRDHGDQYVVKSYPFTNKINDVVRDMKEQTANGGGDFEEAVIEALDDAIYNHNWRDDAEAKLLFLVLDAPPHHTPENISQIHELIKKANEMGIRIIPVASSGIDKDTELLLRFLDISTNGTYIFLTDHSGVGSSHLTPTIGYYQVEQLNDLMVRVINNYVK